MEKSYQIFSITTIDLEERKARIARLYQIRQELTELLEREKAEFRTLTAPLATGSLQDSMDQGIPFDLDRP